MGEFFKGWKRRSGLLTLVMALVLLGGWVRSLSIYDIITFPARKHTNNLTVSFTSEFFGSVKNSVYWGRSHYECDEETAELLAKDDLYGFGASYPRWRTYSVPDIQMKWRWRWCGFGICEEPEERKEGDGWANAVLIPYWAIVLPLTLLSAFLLLSKPRKSTQKKLKEPVPEKLA